jgi:uncharacterized cupredoxin-like copper-binding protein
MADTNFLTERESACPPFCAGRLALQRCVRAATLLFVLSHPLGGIAHDAHPKKTPVTIKKEQKAWGIAGEPTAAARLITINMSDQMRFTPSQVVVKHGETIRFVLKNHGKMLHEMVIGSKQELADHAALMQKFPDMEHDEPYMAHVPQGARGEIIWTFNRVGEFDFACLIAGHFQAGMVGKISVIPR